MVADTSRSPSRSPPRADRSPDRDRSGGRPRSGRDWGRDRDAYSVFVGGLNFDTDERTLRDHFERFGEVDSVRIIYDRETGRSKGIAFVHFAEKESIAIAAERTHGVEIDGRAVRCNPAADGPPPRTADRGRGGRRDDRRGRDRDDSRGHRDRDRGGRASRRSRSRSRSPRGRGRSRSRSDTHPRRSSRGGRRSDRKRSRSRGGGDADRDDDEDRGDLAEARARNAELERRLAALEEAVARSKGSEDGQAARADALESALESAVERQRRRKGLVKKVTKAGAKVARCREELRDAEEKLAGALREAQAALENAAGDEE